MSELFNYRSVLAPYMNSLLEVKASAGISAQRMKWILKEFDDYAHSESLTDPHLTQDFIAGWRKTRVADCDRTIYAKYSVWHQLTTLMSRRGCACFIPKLPVYPKADFTPYIFTAAQITDIFAACDAYRLYDVRMGTSLMAMPALLRMLYGTGARISEALSVVNGDVHLEQGYIHLRKTKNGTERVVPVSETLAGVLQEYVSYRDRMPIAGISSAVRPFFVKPDGTSFQANAVYQFFRKMLDRCGIPFKGNHQGPRVHDLRHTFAVHSLVQMDHNGIDLYTGLPILSACLGHHSLAATEQYVRLTFAMYPNLEKQCSPINAFVYPKLCKAYDDIDRLCQTT
jgi:Site-specific recombinase XerD